MSWAVAVLGYASVIYYLAIKSIPFFDAVFPRFSLLLIFCVFTLIPFGILLGWMHFKRFLSPLYRAEQDIQIEANPYATRITSPVSLPSMRVISELGKLHGIDTTELDIIIQNTEQKFGVRK